MCNSSPSLQHDQQEQTINESDVVSEASLPLNQETLNQPDPPPPTSAPPPPSPSPPPLDPEYNEEGGEIDEGQEQETPAISSGASPHMYSPITAQHVSARDVTLPSPSPGSNTRWSAAGKRKKVKGKGKPNITKQQAIEEKLQSLMVKLKPIPFKPGKIPDFSQHEKLLKKLGLWDFVHIDLDSNIRVDFVAQLIASYVPKNRASKVQDYRINVSRFDFARAFKLPVKKKGNNNAGGVVDVDLECDAFSDDSIGFVRVLVDEWVLLHEDDDMWMMPKEVVVWYKMIKDGHPEKVDWASLFWCMVEKELKQGGQLKDCYYASHLQYLIKFQRAELFFDIKVGIYEEINAPNEEGVCLMEGPSTKLTLGQDGEKEEEGMIVKDVDKCKENDCNKEGREIEEQEEVEKEQGQWLLNGQNKLGEHFMQRCSSGNVEMFERFEEENKERFEEEKKEDEEEMDEDEDVNKFHVFPSDDHLEGEEDGFTGNLLQVMESNQMDFDHDHHHHPQDDQLCNQQSVNIGSIPSFFNSTGKRAIELDSYDINKKLRINDSWVHNNNKQSDFGMCLEQLQKMTERARLFYEEKERATHQSNMHQQLLLSELELRDSIIRKKDEEIYRFERELGFMESVLDGYRNTLKETQRAFSEYREKAMVEEEPTYKDTGLGGLMLTGSEIEKHRKKQEEEEDDKKLRLMFEQKLKEMENTVGGQFEKCAKKALDKQLACFCGDVKRMMKEFEEWRMRKTNKVKVDDEESVKQLARFCGDVKGMMKEFEEWRMRKTNKVKVDDEESVKEGEEPVASSESEEEIDEDEADA